MVENLPRAEYFVLDFKRVLSLNECACGLFYQLLLDASALGKTFLFAQIINVPLLRRYMQAKLGKQGRNPFQSFSKTGPRTRVVREPAAGGDAAGARQ